MKTTLPKPALILLIALLLLGNSAVLVHIYAPETSSLTISFLDVGQGDAILIEGPTGIEMLIDGGKDRSVLRELPRQMGPLDRSIDVLVATHPDADHIGGLPEVLLRYRVAHIITSGKEGDTSFYTHLAEASKKEAEATQTLARPGTRIHLGDGAYADVLHPENNVAQLKDTNDASVVMRLVYGDTEFILTGDAPSWVEDRLISKYGSALRSDVLKAGHHGSKTSTNAEWLQAVDPDVVIISAGKDNSYGHPDPGVVARILDSGAAMLSTIDQGTITFVSDGKRVERK